MTKAARRFIPVDGSSGATGERRPMWMPRAVGDSVEGTFVNAEENVGPHGSNVYTLVTEDDQQIGVWGDTVIDSKFIHIPLETYVRIEYLGRVPSQRGTMYKNYVVEMEG